MTDALRIAELTDSARGLGFSVILLEGPGNDAGVSLRGNDTSFGGTLGECAAFLVGWTSLRSRLLGTMGAMSPMSSMSSMSSIDGPGLSQMPEAPVLRPAARGSSAARSKESDGGVRALDRLLFRDRRQAMVMAWAEVAFGREEATGLPQRGLRLLEEALEAFQACGGTAEIAHALVPAVFQFPPGMIGQELGGVGVATLALAAAVGLSADAEESREIHRVLSRPLEEFTRRNAPKIKIPHGTARGSL